ncbi:unnamed protein product [Peniophora sp. CBMAI 1063]|nr:unnamed protein product [Peniophora sp. CBMAI 1063]
MPPPTAGDAWLKSRKFGIVVDAGSSGSRLQIYSWRDPVAVRDELGDAARYMLPKVEKGAQVDADWVHKVEPGLSSFAENVEDISAYLAPLLDFAWRTVPPSLHAETPLYLLATAGMRLLSPQAQVDVLETTCHFLRFHSNFRIDDPSADGPCGRSVRIITGEEEGMYGWLAVNYLMDGFGPSDSDRTTYGFLDMGGASTQIAFEPSPSARGDATNLLDIRLRMLGGEEIRHQVFVTTWLGYGTNQARERYIRQLLERHGDGVSRDITAVEDPCLPKDLQRNENLLHGADPSQSRKLVGTGSFTHCLAETEPLLNKGAPCRDIPCLFDGVHVPPIDFSASHFIGVSEYWYSSEHIFGLGGAYDFVQYERAAQEYCGQSWNEILRQHEHATTKTSPAAEGASGLSKWIDKVEVSRLELQCFKAAWIVNILHEGLGMPRIVDKGGNGVTHGDDVAEKAELKGLGQTKPTFQSMDTVGDVAISWTLGKMILEASNQVPLPSGLKGPALEDPLQDVPEDAPIQPIRPPFRFLDRIEDHLEPHLHPLLSRDSLGFSFVGFLFYLSACFLFLTLTWRLRHVVRVCIRQVTRSATRRADAAASSMEEGWGGGRPSTPVTPSAPSTKRWMRNIRRMVSFWQTRTSVNPYHGGPPALRRVPASPTRSPNTPTGRSPYSYPALRLEDAQLSINGKAPPSPRTPISPRVASPRVGTPTRLQADNGAEAEALETSSYLVYPRSRNSSTISLSTLTVRQPLSRTASNVQLQ